MEIEKTKLSFLFNTQKSNVFKSNKFSKIKQVCLSVSWVFFEKMKLILPAMSFSFKTDPSLMGTHPVGGKEYCIWFKVTLVHRNNRLLV